MSIVSTSSDRPTLDAVAERPDVLTRAAAHLWDSDTTARRRIGMLAAVVIVVSVIVGRPRHEAAGHRALVLALTVVAGVTFVLWSTVGRSSERMSAACLTVVSVVGGVLGGELEGAAVTFAYMAAFTAGRRLSPRWAAGITLIGLIALVLTGWSTGRVSWWGMAGFGVGFVAVLFAGINQSVRVRLQQQAQLLAAESRDLIEERARSAALAERARIAREIHDVMAHSLSGLVVQLEAASLLLGRDDDAAHHRAAEHVNRARGLARSGLDETRRALQTLRGEALPTADLLEDLVSAYRADTGCPGTLQVTGEVRPLPADVGLTVYRVAQEALTNTRRHAPGASAEVHLDYRPAAVALTIRDHRPDGRSPAATPVGDASARPLPDRPLPDGPQEWVSSGYGLVGMRERAELLGGALSVGPAGDGWLVELRVPA